MIVKQELGHSLLARLYWRTRSGNSWRRREETSWRELTSLVTATLSGTRGRTWLVSLLNSTSSHLKSAQADRVIYSTRTR